MLRSRFRSLADHKESLDSWENTAHILLFLLSDGLWIKLNNPLYNSIESSEIIPTKQASQPPPRLEDYFCDTHQDLSA